MTRRKTPEQRESVFTSGCVRLKTKLRDGVVTIVKKTKDGSLKLSHAGSAIKCMREGQFKLGRSRGIHPNHTRMLATKFLAFTERVNDYGEKAEYEVTPCCAIQIYNCLHHLFQMLNRNAKTRVVYTGFLATLLPEKWKLAQGLNELHADICSSAMTTRILKKTKLFCYSPSYHFLTGKPLEAVAFVNQVQVATSLQKSWAVIYKRLIARLLSIIPESLLVHISEFVGQEEWVYFNLPGTDFHMSLHICMTKNWDFLGTRTKKHPRLYLN